ncbi:MAG: BON domain-containing protein [Planctomycetaceae bacterium]|nr:BON domain-containing protein [Planctomycetaceae bacterium]
MAASVSAQTSNIGQTTTGSGQTTNNSASTSGNVGLTGGGQLSTTGGAGAATANSLQAVGSDSGGFAGANATQTFIGGASTDAFVGGGRQTQSQAANRQFRAIQNTQVPTSTNQQQGGSPRQVRVSFRVNIPGSKVTEQPPQAIAPANRVSFDRVLATRPELASVNIAFSADGVARLSGVVNSAETKRLAVALMRLQPGVREVADEIQLTQ